MRDMKDSGVEWLGKIPNHWTIQRIKNLFELRNERNYEALEDVNLISLYTDKGVVQHSDLTETTGNKAVTADGYKIVKENDIVVNIILCWMGAVGRSDYNGVTSPACDVYKPLGDTNSKYYHYLFRTSQFNGECYRYGRGIMLMRWRTYSTEFKAISIPVPPADEQQRIVEFLDEKVNDVARLIANVQKQIEKLKSYKQSLITEVVTKGLDSTVPMKDSGVDVYPFAPQHWNVQKTLTLLTMPITDGPHTTPELFSEGIPFVSAEAVSCGNGSIDFNHIRGYISQEFYDECCKKYVPQMNDIYMIKSGATTGRVSVVDTDRVFTIWSPLAVFRSNPNLVHFRFLYYFLQSTAYQRQVQFGWTYGTQQNIGMRTLERLKVFVPPLDEQYAIAEYLDSKCVYFDHLIAIKQSKIEKLEQYKRSIIYEYVTGKREVS